MLITRQSFATAAQDVLLWYSEERRHLPWRAAPTTLADPYCVWLSEIMLQQTNVTTVAPYYFKFLQLWPDVEALANAQSAAVMQAWAGLGYYSRARNLHLCAQQICREFGGAFPDSEAQLLKLPGIGPYTAAAIAAIAFGHNSVVVDGNIERVMARLFTIETPLPKAKLEMKQRMAQLTPLHHAGDFAQALMDIGAGICTPKNPKCRICPLAGACMAFENGKAERYPLKGAKLIRPQRRGHVYIVQRRDGAVLVETNPPHGLLGGMTCFPNSGWTKSKASGEATQPLQALFRELDGEVHHIFTHFSLALKVHQCEVLDDIATPPAMRWVSLTQLEGEALPSLMRKVLRHWRLP